MFQAYKYHILWISHYTCRIIFSSYCFGFWHTCFMQYIALNNVETVKINKFQISWILHLDFLDLSSVSQELARFWILPIFRFLVLWMLNSAQLLRKVMKIIMLSLFGIHLYTCIPAVHKTMYTHHKCSALVSNPCPSFIEMLFVIWEICWWSRFSSETYIDHHSGQKRNWNHL